MAVALKKNFLMQDLGSTILRAKCNQKVELRYQPPQTVERVVFDKLVHLCVNQELFQQTKDIIPHKIQNTEVEIIIRENYGMSYAAFNEVFEKYKDNFDYYIFNEDDYFFNDHNFDTY